MAHYDNDLRAYVGPAYYVRLVRPGLGGIEKHEYMTGASVGDSASHPSYAGPYDTRDAAEAAEAREARWAAREAMGLRWNDPD